MNDFQVLPANTKGKKPLACWQMLAGYGNERYNGEKLFGQDQLVFTSDAQQVTLTGMFDFNGGVTPQNFLAFNAQSNSIAVCDWCGEWWFGLGFHDESKCKRE